MSPGKRIHHPKLQIPLRQQPAHNLGHRFFLLTIDRHTQPIPEFEFHTGNQRIRFRLRFGSRCHANVRLPRMRGQTYRWVRRRHQVTDPPVDIALPYRAGPEYTHPDYLHTAHPIHQYRDDGMLHHMRQFPGNTGQTDNESPPFRVFAQKTRRRSDGILQRQRSLRKIRLPLVIRGHLPPETAEPGRNLPLQFLAVYQIPPRRTRDRLPGHVIHCRPDAPRGNHHIRPIQRKVEYLRYAILVVSDGGLVIKVHTDVPERHGQQIRIRIDNLSQKKLGSNHDDLCAHNPPLGDLSSSCVFPNETYPLTPFLKEGGTVIGQFIGEATPGLPPPFL